MIMAMLLSVQGHRPAVLDRLAEAVQRPHPRITAPGEDELAGAAHADQLVIDQVRGHTYQREVTLLLSDHLVPGRKGDKMRKPFHCDNIAIPDETGNGFAQRRNFSHSLLLKVVVRLAREYTII